MEMPADDKKKKNQNIDDSNIDLQNNDKED
jgi:hypothetical protein